jgi:muramidase (phage lysozyme)
MTQITPSIKALLDAIGKHEAPKGYGQIYSGAKGVPSGADVSKMKLKEVQALQRLMIANGSRSTASGRYQFIKNTLNTTIIEMGLTGEEVWGPELQDQMAVHLIKKRGLNKYLDGQITREDFANNLAKEWASLPVVTNLFNGKREVEVGQSYYAGDGLNKAFHKPETILALIDALKKDSLEAPVEFQPSDAIAEIEAIKIMIQELDDEPTKQVLRRMLELMIN